jgi:thymidine kinase
MLESITSHNGENIDAQPVKSAVEIMQLIQPETTVVAVDEVQFLDSGIVEVAEALANHNLRVILAGLDLDFRAEPFGSMPQLMSIAEEVTKLRAICVVCGEAACRSQRLVNGHPAHYHDPIIMVGAQESYEARCRKHHAIPGAPHAHPSFAHLAIIADDHR